MKYQVFKGKELVFAGDEKEFRQFCKNMKVPWWDKAPLSILFDFLKDDKYTIKAGGEYV